MISWPEFTLPVMSLSFATVDDEVNYGLIIYSVDAGTGTGWHPRPS